MKHLKLFYSITIGISCLLISCSEDNKINKNEDPIVNTETPTKKMLTITGIDAEYSAKIGTHFKLIPKVEKNNDEQLTYEWSIDFKKVSTNEKLDYICSKPGKFSCYLKIKSSKGNAKIVEFTLYVYTGYDQGLLLYTTTNGKAQLSYKSINEMEVPAVKDVFTENNPTLTLGTVPLCLAWTGEGITNPQNLEESNPLEVVMACDNPRKIYLLDAVTLKAKNEVKYNGNNNSFSPNTAFVPYGNQNFLWNKDFNVIYFIGGGRDYLMTSDHNFILGKRSHQLPSYVKIADMVCNLITNPMDMVRVYFDIAQQHLIYVCGIRGVAESKISTSVKPIALLACNGKYASQNADYRYEPNQILLIGEKANKDIMIYHIAPTANKQQERLISEKNVSGRITKTDAIGINPISPILYYGNNKGEIKMYNYIGENFSDKPFIQLGEQYNIKKIVFNPYNKKQMYVAAQDTKAPINQSATIFIINITDNEKGKIINKSEHLGGEIHNLIYKGNGTEMWEHIK